MYWYEYVLGVSLLVSSACCGSRFRLESVTGDVQVVKGSVRAPLLAGAIVGAGDVIEARAGHAVISMGNGERYHVYPGSTLIVRPSRRAHWLDRLKMSGTQSRWRPVIAVRG